ncbi:potassium voltage-gated channel subfamily H member 2-like, partial [Brachionus plicatilis]
MAALFTSSDVKGYNSKLSNVSLEKIENVKKECDIMSQKRPRKKSKCKQDKEDSESSSLAEQTSASAIDHVVKKFHQKFIILHYSPFKAVWDWIVLLLVVYTAIFTPFTVAFLLNDNEKRAKLNQHASTRLFKKQQLAGADPFVMLDLIVDLMFLIDVFINFRTTFVSKQGDVVYDPMIIAKSYFKGWFFIDALSGMPYDLLLFGSGNIDTIKLTGYLKTIRLMRLIRIFPKL